MSISLKTHKMLWGRSGSRCSIPECRKILVEQETDTDDSSIIGDEAHIVAREMNGPRGKSDLTEEQRDKFANLILLCKVHHKIIDDQPQKYTVEQLKEIKKNHIIWVDNNLNIDKDKQKDDEIYAEYVDTLANLAEINNWNGWSSFVLGGSQPRLYEQNLDKLTELNQYLLGRIWPGRYPELESAFSNFRIILNDFLKVFLRYVEKGGKGKNTMYYTRKFYHLPDHNPKLYDELYEKYEYHILLVGDLIVELTRAGNLLCDRIRKYLSGSFRIKEGILLITTGPNKDLSWTTHRVEYNKSDPKEQIYPGLRGFMIIRESRDLCFGRGSSDEYFPYH